MVNYTVNPEYIARRIAGYEKASAIIWVVLGIIQLLLGFELPFFFIIGIWNIIVAVSRFKMVDRIRSLDPAIPDEYEGIVGLILFGIANVLLGAIFGIAGIIIDFYVRSQILGNREIFTHEVHGMDGKRDSPSTEDSYRILEKLGELKDKKIITEEEFLREKSKIFDNM